MRTVRQASASFECCRDSCFGLIGRHADVDVGPATPRLGRAEALERDMRVTSVPIDDVFFRSKAPVPEDCGPERTHVAACILCHRDAHDLDLGGVRLDPQLPSFDRNLACQLDIPMAESSVLPGRGPDCDSVGSHVHVGKVAHDLRNFGDGGNKPCRFRERSDVEVRVGAREKDPPVLDSNGVVECLSSRSLLAHRPMLRSRAFAAWQETWKPPDFEPGPPCPRRICAMTNDLVGRDMELATIERHLSRALHGESTTCVIEGGIGIGKTALLAAAIGQARRRGFLVLSARPVEAETAFSFAALSDIVRPQLAAIIDRLARPQRAALEAALLLRDVEGDPPEPHAVAVAAVSALALLVEAQPVLVAVDDAQWLDAPSRLALQYVARRLPARVALVVAQRSDRDVIALAADVEHLRLGPMSLGALQQLIHDRVGIALTRPALARVHDATAGFPLFALEIARALRASGVTVKAMDPLPVPPTLRELVANRLAAISPTARRALISVAASARPSRSLIDGASLAEALSADLVEVDDESLRFTHPLLGSVLYASAPANERRAAHRYLADLSTDEEESARHLALAADGPDTAIAARLDAAAALARSRGAPSAAAELMERARDLTPATETAERLRRSIDAAEFCVEARLPGAESMVENVLASTTGDLRARALTLLALVRGNREASAAPPLLEEALRHVSDPAIELKIRLEIVNPNFRAPTAHSHAHAERAIELATGQGDNGLLAAALASQAALMNHPIDALERAAAIEADSRASVQARFQVAWAQLYRGSDAGRAQLAGLLGTSLTAGLRAHNRVISLLSYAETRAGDPRRGRELAEEFLQYGVAERNLLAELAALCARGYASAWLGDIDDAKADAEKAIGISDTAGYVGRSIQAYGIRGFIDLTRGDVSGAVADFRHAVIGLFDASLETLPPVAHTRLVLPTVVADAVDAFCMGGVVDECQRLVPWLERDSTNPWLVALSAYARGLVAEASSEHEVGLASLHDAVRRFESLALPLDLGRALLALGMAQRRARQRSAARDALERAAATFERAGAGPWADKARSETDRIGGRRAFGDELTPSERRIALLVAQGKKNREVAAALVVTERTVEAALTLIYRKLDVRSRTELARKLRAD